MTKELKRNNVISLFLAALMLAVSFLMPVVQNVSNAEGTGTITIHKYRPGNSGESDGASDGQEHTGTGLTGKFPVKGVGYKIKQTHSFEVSGTGADRYISAISEIASPTTTTHYTDENGEIKLTAMPYGRYEFTELLESEYTGDKPTGIVFPIESKTYRLELPGTKKDDNKTLFDDVHAYPKSNNNTAGLMISKKGKNPKTNETESLQGAEFRIYTDAAAQNEVVNKPEDNTPYELPFVTGEDGQVTINGLEDGKTYYVVETKAPAGYAINDRRPRAIKISNGNETQELSFDNTELIKEVKTENAGDSISIEKELTYSIYTTVPEDIQDIQTFTIQDYLQKTDDQYVAFIKNGTLKYYLDVPENEVSDSTRTALPIGVVNWTTEMIAGNYNGNPVGGKEVGFKVNLKDSRITLPQGAKDINDYAGKRIRIDYTVILTDAANGKDVTNKAEQIIPTTIDNQETTAEVINTVTASKSKLVLTKKDLETSEVLKDAKFQLKKKTGDNTWIDVSTEQITNASGMAEWDNLGEGTYKLVETEAPIYYDGDYNGMVKSYVISEKEVEVIIKAEDLNSQKDITITNRKPKWYLPATGGFGYYVFTLVSIILIAIGLGIFGYKKKQVKA